MTRLRIPLRSRVTEILCPLCGQWRKPRHIRVPAMVCRHCETTPTFQTWRLATRAAASAYVPAGGPR